MTSVLRLWCPFRALSEKQVTIEVRSAKIAIIATGKKIEADHEN